MPTLNTKDLRDRLEKLIVHLEIEAARGARTRIEAVKLAISALEEASEEIRDKQTQITDLTERLARGRRYIRWSLSSDTDRDLKLDALADFLPRTPAEGEPPSDMPFWTVSHTPNGEIKK